MLETPRLILRPHRADDIDAYVPLWAPPAGAPSYTPVLDAEGAWARLLRLIGHRAVLGFAPFVVEERGTGRLVGEVGFARFRRGLGPRFDAAAEAMWIVDRHFRGKGLGGEAMTAATAWFDATFPDTRSVCMIDPANDVSLALATRLGFVAFEPRVRNGRDVVLFERGG